MSLDHTENGHPTLDDLESLFVNNLDLDTIRAHLACFNPIKTMGMERMEIRHSAILAWLLDPQQTHGLGDNFLKAFLAEALRGHDSSALPSALDVSQADLIDAEIRREWRHIDLLVLSPRNGWVFIIENKFDSDQHGNQLMRYMKIVDDAFMGGDTYQYVRGVFLTLWEEEPEDARYAPIEYASICELLKQQALSGRQPLTSEVEVFLKHYLEIILEATGMSGELNSLEKLARQLYRDHKRVLEFIVEHGKSTDFAIACDAVFGEDLKHPNVTTVENCDFVFCFADARAINFLPKSWFDTLGGEDFFWPGCENWAGAFPVIVWFNLSTDATGSGGHVRFYAEVGPLKDYGFRKKLIAEIRKIAKENPKMKIGFQRGADDEGRKYSKFFKENSFVVEDIHDHDKIANAMMKALKDFRPEIDAVAAILPEFLSYGQKESLE